MSFSNLISFLQDTSCRGCDSARASTMLQLYGQPYHPTTLQTVSPSEEASMNRVSTPERETM
jgi:hypothetical protein